MHCHRKTDVSIHLKDSALEKDDHLMDFPAVPKQKIQLTKARDTEKKVFVAIEANENDILLGRGGKNNMHAGNEKLRELARKVADKYHRSSKKEKSYLSRSLVQQVLEMDPPGRFLRRHPKDNHWEDMSHDEDKCREKCAQVLRDAVAYVGLKEPPPSRPTQMEQRQQIYPFHPSSRNDLLLQASQQQQYPRQYDPFAMSAATSSSIMHQHMMTNSNLPPASRQFSFPNFNPPSGRKNYLGPIGGGYDPLAMPSVASAYAQMPFSATSIPQGDQRATKRRRFSNYFDQYGNAHQAGPTIHGYPAELGYEQPQQAPVPGSANSRRDSFLGNISVTDASDHSGPTMKDFELFPDITATVDAGTQPPSTSKNDGDEFSSEFY